MNRKQVIEQMIEIREQIMKTDDPDAAAVLWASHYDLLETLGGKQAELTDNEKKRLWLASMKHRDDPFANWCRQWITEDLARTIEEDD